jgi:hypothetical protein
MNHMQILKRAWKILWSYRALWIFGIILALTSASSGGNSNGGSSSSSPTQQRTSNFQLPPEMQSAWDQISKAVTSYFTPTMVQQWIGIGIALVCLALLVGLFFTIAKYVSKTASIRMVDTYETSGEKLTWKQGVRLGWSRTSWRLFLIDLFLCLPVFLAVVVLGGCAAAPVLVSAATQQTPSVASIVISVGLGILVILAMIAAMVLFALVIETIHRTCVLEGTGVTESIRKGWKLVRANLKDVGLMWLILAGLRFAYFLVAIPVVILLLGISLVLGGGFGALLYFIAQSASGAAAGWITAAIGGGLIFLVSMFIPVTFANGLNETYHATVWTLTYRELKALMLQKSSLPIVSESV